VTSHSAFRGIAAPLMRINVDTDAIIPSREMKRVSKTGLAEGLFANWRYLDPGAREPNPDFILNQAPFDRASILLAGSNFGCGSSREHAVWALGEWGIRAVIAPSFGSIFAANCLNNGLLPVRLDEQAVGAIAAEVMEDPLANQVTVVLGERLVLAGRHTW
jgi:3-isopropylmalate/(R)-2-methylmalate dehydratase small subunit